MFNGTPVLEQISPKLHPRMIRISGITLDANASMVVAFPGAPVTDPGALLLPEDYQLPTTLPDGVSLAALVKVDIHPIGTGPFTNLPPTIEKIPSACGLHVQITNTNVNERTQDLEIYVTLLDAPAISPDQMADIVARMRSAAQE